MIEAETDKRNGGQQGALLVQKQKARRRSIWLEHTANKEEMRARFEDVDSKLWSEILQHESREFTQCSEICFDDYLFWLPSHLDHHRGIK